MLQITDSHFHIWNMDVLNLRWLDHCPSIKRSFSISDLRAAYARHDVNFNGGVYIEVDCDNYCQEDDYIYHLQAPEILAKVMRAPHLCKHMRLPAGIAGVREPLHIPTSPKGRCLDRSFIEGLETLASQHLLFESCNRVEELGDLYQAASQVPQADIVINHCGNVAELTTNYKKNMLNLASLPNVYCKVSGFATQDATFVKNLLDFLTGTFRPSRLIYASNFPVVSLYSAFDEHLNRLRDYFGDDPDFFSKNTKKLYKINSPQVYASVIRLRQERTEYYKQLHQNPFSGINDMIRQCGITDYRIYYRDGLLFSIMTYCGDDFEYDMNKMAQDPCTKKWWAETDPCQKRIENAYKDEWWAGMEKVYDLHSGM